MAQQALVAPVAERRVPMTYQEWLRWPESQERRSEWVDGEAIVFMPPTMFHALVVNFLSTLLTLYADTFDLGQVIATPAEMRLPTSAREPNIFFVKTENLWRLTPERLVGPADLAIELISDDSVTRDRRDKYREYAAAGVPEYWLLDPRPDHQQADFYALGRDGTYEPLPLDGEGRFASRVLPGFWLDPAWLWQEPLPKPAEVLRQIVPGGA